jgi:hypothetical protein
LNALVLSFSKKPWSVLSNIGIGWIAIVVRLMVLCVVEISVDPSKLEACMVVLDCSNFFLSIPTPAMNKDE